MFYMELDASDIYKCVCVEGRGDNLEDSGGKKNIWNTPKTRNKFRPNGSLYELRVS